MADTLEFTLNNPLTEEQWDMITDVDFDHTDRIWFHTKHCKEVEFAKVIRCKECIKKPFCTIYQKTNDEHGYCSLAVRPVTCDCCKHWNGLKRDGHYWCYKHSTYMETGCKEGRRNEFNSDLP